MPRPHVLNSPMHAPNERLPPLPFSPVHRSRSCFGQAGGRKGAAVTVRRLARLGGAPAFAQTVPITRPTLPPYRELAPHLRRVLESGMITKGAYLRELED